MSDPSDIDELAAEYVLGTLDAGERAMVAARRQREPVLDAAIIAWQRRLAPLDDFAPAVEPPSGIFGAIEQKIAARGSRASGMLAGDAGSTIITLQRRLRRWRISAIAAGAAAASLVVAFAARELLRPETAQNYVAVFQKDDASPAFVMTVDLTARTLSIRRVAAPVPAGKTYQLWIASDKLGPGPHSLGLIEDQNAGLQKAIAKLDPTIVQSALFGVSLEPAGGSPTGKPTGPVFHTRLIPTSE